MNLFKNKLILAPMSGITEPVFRFICRKNGVDIVISEMVSAEGIYYNSKKTIDLINFKPGERPIGIQLFGANAKHLAYAAQYVEEHAQPDFIDVNSGCPVPKVVKKNGGSALLKDPGLFKNILSHMVKAVSVPVTVKIRSGWYKHQWVDTEFAKIAEDSGVAAITVHPRSKTMGFTGHSYWDRISLVKKAVTIPVIGNGDIVTPEDGLKMFSQTGCDSIMIGRATYGNPWIFRKIKEMRERKTVTSVTKKEKYNTVLHHLNEYRHTHGDLRAVKEMKKFISWYLRGEPGAAVLRDKIFRAKNIEELEEIAKIIF
jgi:nifR3 family TIM-barrel protein